MTIWCTYSVCPLNSLDSNRRGHQKRRWRPCLYKVKSRYVEDVKVTIEKPRLTKDKMEDICWRTVCSRKYINECLLLTWTQLACAWADFMLIASRWETVVVLLRKLREVVREKSGQNSSSELKTPFLVIQHKACAAADTRIIALAWQFAIVPVGAEARRTGISQKLPSFFRKTRK